MAAASPTWAQPGVRWIAGGWSVFIAENLILSENRQAIISRLSDDGYHYLYNTLSTMATGSIAYGYLRHRSSPPVMTAKPLAAFVLQALGLVGISQLLPALQAPVAAVPATAAGPPAAGAVQQQELRVRCPIDFASSRGVGRDEVYGAKRVTRHPMFYSIAALGMGCALANPSAPALLALGVGPLAMSLVGTHHQDSRQLRGIGGKMPELVARTTSNLPFAALLDGRQSWSSVGAELKHVNAGAAASLALALALRRRGGGR